MPCRRLQMPKPYQPQDRFTRRARLQGFKARSVYKLQELNNEFQLINPNFKVLDIGSAPGSWLQFISSQIRPNGIAIGIDLKQTDKIADNVQSFTVNINDADKLSKIFSELNIDQFDLIVSDIAPNTTGI